MRFFTSFLVLAAACAVQPALSLREEHFLYASTWMAGLCNQLFQVLSYAQLARLAGCNTLVLGPMYSRKSFQHSFSPLGAVDGHDVLPFSAFFDLQHYTEFWAKRGLVVITQEEFEQRYPLVSLEADTTFLKPLREWGHGESYTEAEVAQMAAEAKAAAQLKPSFAVDSSTAARLLDYDWTTMFRFREGRAAYADLVLAVESLKPAAQIQRVADALLALLPPHFVALHARIEPDATAEGDVLAAVAKAVARSNEYFSSARGKGAARLVYVASGVFAANAANQGRAALLLSECSTAGIELTHKELLVAQCSPALAADFAALLPEQAALLDLHIMLQARHAEVSSLSSSFSYMLVRLRQLKHAGVAPLIDRDTQQHLGFWAWGL